jgi:hypothetical protein
MLEPAFAGSSLLALGIGLALWREARLCAALEPYRAFKPGDPLFNRSRGHREVIPTTGGSGDHAAVGSER